MTKVSFYPMFGPKLSPEEAQNRVLLTGNHQKHFEIKSQNALRFSREIVRREHLGLSTQSDAVRLYLDIQDYRANR